MCHTVPGPVSRRPLDPSTLAAAAEAFDLDPGRLVFVRDVANIVHAHSGPSGDDACFLRLTHRDDRSPGDVQAELRWLAFLAERGLPVCRPRPARDGRLSAQADTAYRAACFERVRGVACTPEAFAAPVFEQMGAFLGRVHRVSATYTPPPDEPQRLHWHALDPPERVRASWAPADAWLFDRFETLRAGLRARRVAPERYGLVHGDVHRGNIFVHEAGIDVFDFDDCCRAFLAMDVAHALYYALWDRRYEPEPERSAFARSFLECLLTGYRRHSPFDDDDLALLPELLEYRELCVDAFSHRRRPDPDTETRRRWGHVRERLRGGRPYVAIDLDGL